MCAGSGPGGPGTAAIKLIWSLLVALLLVAAFWLLYLRPMTPPDQEHAVHQVLFYPGDARPPADGGEPRSLPDDWMRTATDTTSGWYRVLLDLPRGRSEPWALYLPVIHMNADIFLNDWQIGRSTQFPEGHRRGDPYARELNRPVFLLLPDAVLKPGENELRIHVRASWPGSGLLGPVYAGPADRLQAAWEGRLAARITMIQLISAGMLTVAVFMTVLWYLRPGDSVYGWFALLVYTWTLHNVFFLGWDTPLPAPAEDFISLATLGWFVVFMVIATHRYLGPRPVLLERLMLGIAGVGTLILAASNLLDGPSVLAHRLWSSLALTLGAYAVARVALAYRDREDLKNPFVATTGLSILALGTHDWLVIMGFWPREGGLLLHFSAPVTLIVFATLLLERFTRVLRTAERLNVELEQRVAEKHRQLEENYTRLRAMENRQILNEERERFMKEMHDGVGGHLVSMLAMIRAGGGTPEKITRALQEALNDLRIMIDSLDPNEHDLPALLGAMRARLEPQLAGSRMRFRWAVNEMPPIPEFGPRKALQVMRILQEAVTNIVNHAEASLIHIRARVEESVDGGKMAVLDVEDDGKGIAADAQRGRGMSNMAQRAESIGATLEISPADPGTRVRLTLPFPEPVAGA